MVQARLLVDLPSEAWVATVSEQYPDTEFQVLAATPTDTAGYGLVEISPDQSSILAEIENQSVINTAEIIYRHDNTAVVQFETTKPLILFSARQSGLPIQFPISIQDGIATIDVVGTHDRLSELGEQLASFGMDYQLEWITERTTDKQVLTQRQYEVLETAYEAGYYQIDRECTIADIANQLDIAQSTCGETLQRAENAIIADFIKQRRS